MVGVVDGLGAGTGIHGQNFGSGIHMEDWKGPAPYLASIQTAAGVASGIISSVSAAAGPIGAAAGGGLNMVLGAISSGLDAHDTQKTVAGLKALLTGPISGMAAGQDKIDLTEIVELAIKKKTRHRDIAISESASLGISKIGTAAYRMGRAIHKKRTGTKGKSREAAADKLLTLANGGNLIAKQIIILIAKQNFDSMLKNSLTDALRS